MSEWEDFLGGSKETEAAPAPSPSGPGVEWPPSGEGLRRLDVLVAELFAAETQIDMLKAERETLIGEIARLVPEQEVEETPLTNYSIKVKRPETWKWDDAELAGVFGADPMPPYVTQSLSISRKAFEALSPAERAKVIPALTRTHGKAKIMVRPKETE